MRTDEACNFIPTCFAHFSLACWQKPSGARSHIPAVVHLSHYRTNTLSSHNFFWNGAAGQTIFVGKSAESGCAFWYAMGRNSLSPRHLERSHTDRHLAKDHQNYFAEPIFCMSVLDAGALYTQGHGCSSPDDAFLFAIWTCSPRHCCSQPHVFRCDCLLTATCISSSVSPFSSETWNQVKLAQCHISLPNGNAKLKEAPGPPRFTSLLSAGDSDTYQCKPV